MTPRLKLEKDLDLPPAQGLSDSLLRRLDIGDANAQFLRSSRVFYEQLQLMAGHHDLHAVGAISINFFHPPDGNCFDGAKSLDAINRARRELDTSHARTDHFTASSSLHNYYLLERSSRRIQQN